MNTETLTCAICHEMLLDPRTLPCGHNYCGKTNGLDVPCINGLFNDGVVTCSMDNRKFTNFQLSDLRTNIILRDTIDEYRNIQRNKCTVHNKNLDLVCLTCGEQSICLSCMKDHPRHEMTSGADHVELRRGEICAKIADEKRSLEERVVNGEEALKKLVLLTEEVMKYCGESRHSLDEVASSEGRCMQAESTFSWPEFEKLEAKKILEQKKVISIRQLVRETLYEVSEHFSQPSTTMESHVASTNSTNISTCVERQLQRFTSRLRTPCWKAPNIVRLSLGGT